MAADVSFACRSCGSRDCDQIVDLGAVALCNDFLDDPAGADGQARESVELVMCRECRLLQLRELVDRERLFGAYPWTSSSSRSAREYAGGFARRLAARTPGGLAVEIASNDGLMLRALRDAGFAILGVEPSNLAAEADAAGLPTVHAFFDARSATAIRDSHGPATLILARNCVGHSSDLVGMLSGAAALLAEDGLFVIEVPYAAFLRDLLQYDTVFHEHVSYFSLRTLATALARPGLSIVDVEFSPLNGGSLVCDVRRTGHPVGPAVDRLLELEALAMLNEPDGWLLFARSVQAHRTALTDLLRDLRRDGPIVVYGAAAKTVMLLNHCRIGPELITAVADASPRKQGLFVPGVGIPVVAPTDIKALSPAAVMVGPANLRQEIVDLLRQEVRYAGPIYAALPIPRLLEAATR